MSRYILGIDPGLGGALALYDYANPHLAEVWDMPVEDGKVDAPTLAALVAGISNSHPVSPYGDLVAVIENVGSRPGQQGAFNFGLATGTVHGVLAAEGLAMTLVAPSVWKARMGLKRFPDERQDENKTRARMLATQLFPHLKNQLKRVKDDGRAEALLMAVYHANHSCPQMSAPVASATQIKPNSHNQKADASAQLEVNR